MVLVVASLQINATVCVVLAESQRFQTFVFALKSWHDPLARELGEHFILDLFAFREFDAFAHLK